MSESNIEVKITADSSQAIKTLEELEKKVERIGGDSAIKIGVVADIKPAMNNLNEVEKKAEKLDEVAEIEVDANTKSAVEAVEEVKDSIKDTQKTANSLDVGSKAAETTKKALVKVDELKKKLEEIKNKQSTATSEMSTKGPEKVKGKLEQIKAKLDEIKKKSQHAFDGIGSKLGSIKAKLSEAMSGANGGQLASLGQKAAGILAGVGVALVGVGTSAVTAAAKMEQTRTAFTNMLGSAEKSGKFISDLQSFAAKTPFEFEQVTAASQKFLAFGFTAEQVIPTLTAVGNAASALGSGEEGINRMSLALGQMAAKGKISGEEMLQLTESGIPAWELLANAIGKSIPEAMDLVSKGAIDSQTGLEALVNGMGEKYAGMMDAQSKTISGLWSTVQDNVSQTMVAIGDSLIDALNLKPILEDVGNFLNEFRAKVQSAGIGEALKTMIPPGVGVAIAGLTTALVALAVVGLAPVVAGMGAFITATGPVIAVCAAVGAAAYLVWKHFDQIKLGIQNLMSHFSGFQNALNAVKNAVFAVGNMFVRWHELMKPVIRFLAVVLVGALAVVGGAFMGLLSVVLNVVSGIVNTVSSVVNFFSSIFEWVASKLNWVGDCFMELANSVLPEWASSSIQSVVDFVNECLGLLDAVISKVKEVAAALGFAMSGVSMSGETGAFDAEGNLISEDGGSGKTKFGQFGGGGGAPSHGSGGSGGGSGGGGKSEGEKLADKAKEASKRISDAWHSMFDTQTEAAERWYQAELEELDKTKDANENYEKDRQALTEMYSKKRMDAVYEEGKKIREIQSKVKDLTNEHTNQMTVLDLKGSARMYADMAIENAKAMDSIESRWQEASDYYAGLTAKQQEAFRAALDKNGVAYSLDADKQISFAKQIADEKLKQEERFYTERNSLRSQFEAIEKDMQIAKDEGDIVTYMEQLERRKQLGYEELEFKKKLITEYETAYNESQFRMEELTLELRNKGFGELSNSISGMLQGTMSLQTAFQNLGKIMLKTVADYVSNWISNQLKMAVLGKQQAAQNIATTTATMSAIDAAATSAAITVSIATQGAAATQGLTAFMTAKASGSAMGAIGRFIPKFADGGYITGPTIGMIGEGKYNEAVFPLSDDTFDRFAEGINRHGGSGQVVYNIQAMDSMSFMEFLERTGGRALQQFTTNQNREFGMEVGVW